VVVVPLGKDNKPLGQGSGFIIAANEVVTNHHVLEEATSAAVIFADGSTEAVEGFLADNPTRDIIIISVKTGRRVPLRLGEDLALKQGDEVFANGAPRGLELSITNGIVSGFRSIEDHFFLQTTAAIAPGSSGGPLFNKAGEVIGMTTSLLANTPGIYFAVGIGDVARIMRSSSTLVLPISSMPGVGRAESSAKVESFAKIESPAQDLPAQPIRGTHIFHGFALKDGYATDYIYNYFGTLEEGKTYSWTTMCIEQPYKLFHKDERLVLYVWDKSQRVKTGRFTSEKSMVGKICGATSGCFKVMIKDITTVAKSQ
jgi:Trypsin-like peptidase domain